MNCPSCGSPVDTHARFCGNCGAHLPPQNLPSPYSSAHSAPGSSQPAAQSPDELIRLGKRYADGDGVPQSDSEAALYYEKAARLGSAEAQFLFACCSYSGKGLPKSDASVTQWLQASADQGYGPAMGLLGSLFFIGDGVPQSDTTAVHLLQRAAEQKVAYAQNMLGYCYIHGRGVAKNLREADRLTRMALDGGAPDAPAQLADILLRDPSLAHSTHECIDMYRQAAEQGNLHAMTFLGFQLVKIHQDAEAARWFLKAAEAGDPRAQISIGLMYQDGQGIAPSASEAARWIEKAAVAGKADAQLLLGDFYRDGFGLQPSSSEARRWYQTSASQGNKAALARLQQLESHGASLPTASVSVPGVVLGAQDKTLAPNSAPIEQPLYGFTVHDEPDRIVFHVPEREAPFKSSDKVMQGCGLGCVSVMAIPFLAWIGAAIGAIADTPGCILGALAGSALAIILVVWFKKYNQKIYQKQYEPFCEATVVIDPKSIQINGIAYDRSHTRELSTRWTNFQKSSFFAAGKPSFVAGAAIGHAYTQNREKQIAEKSYEVTFDYGNKQVRIVGGMNEAMARAFMEAFSKALQRIECKH